MHKYWRHLGDYAKATGHLSLLEHGAYTVLLDLAYDKEAPLPADEVKLFKLCRARTASEKAAVRSVLMEFFVNAGEGWVQSRVLAEIAEYQGKREKTRDAAAKRWHCGSNADALPDGCSGNASRARSDNQQPTTNNQQPIPAGGLAPPGGEMGLPGLSMRTEADGVGLPAGDDLEHPAAGSGGEKKERGDGPEPVANRRSEGPEFPGDLAEGYRGPLTLWWRYKREKRAGYKSAGWAVLVARERKFPAAVVAASVEASMANNWEGLFTHKIDLRAVAAGGGEKKEGGGGGKIAEPGWDWRGVALALGLPVMAGESWVVLERSWQVQILRAWKEGGA